MNNNYEYPEWEEILKRFALWGGIALAIVSMYFSWDGLDQSYGGNPNYTEIAQIIGVVMAVAVTLIQFIFNTDISKQSATLRLIGIVSYVYSMITNYLGIEHLFGFSGIIGVSISAFMDLAPEAMIAWALNDTVSGDMLGNIFKSAMGARPKGGKRQNNQQYTATTHTPAHQNRSQKGKGREFWETQKQGQSKGQGNPLPHRPAPKNDDTQPKFRMFEE